MKRAYVLIAALVAMVVVSWVAQYLGFRRGYHTALNHQKAQLIIILNALDQIHAANVDGATTLNEQACFTLANQFVEDERYQSDPDIRALMPRLTKYWDTYCADRKNRLWTEERFGSLLAQRR